MSDRSSAGFLKYQVRDRLSFTRFLRLGIEDSIPDATTLWLFREQLATAGLIEKLFDRFDQHLASRAVFSAGHSQTLAVASASECEPQQKQNSARRARVCSSTDCWAAGSYARSASCERAR
jgi:IS5 family transposase